MVIGSVGENIKKFFRTNKVSGTNSMVEQEFHKHYILKKDSKLNFMPMVLINGYQLPVGYSIQDIEFLFSSTS